MCTRIRITEAAKQERRIDAAQSIKLLNKPKYKEKKKPILIFRRSSRKVLYIYTYREREREQKGSIWGEGRL